MLTSKKRVIFLAHQQEVNNENPYQNLDKVPPQLQHSSKRLIDNTSKGLGIPHGQPPIPVKYPPEIDQVLRSLDNRSEYIRQAVKAKLEADKLI